MREGGREGGEGEKERGNHLKLRQAQVRKRWSTTEGYTWEFFLEKSMSAVSLPELRILKETLVPD